MRNFILVVLAVVAFAGSDAVRSQDVVRSSILTAWEARAKKHRVISGEFQLETTLYPTKNARAITDLLQKEEKLSNTYSFIIDFAKGRYRVQNTKDEYSIDSKRFDKVTYINIFDGTCLKSATLPPTEGATRVGKPGGLCADFAVVRSNLHDYPLDFLLVPFILAEGRFPKPGDQTFYPNSFHSHSLGESEDMLAPDRSPIPANSRESRWQVGPTKFGKSVTSILVGFDTANESQVGVYTIRTNERVLNSIRIQYEQGHPASFEVQQYLTHKETLYGKFKARVTRFQYLDAAPEGEFNYEPAPGMVVAEVTGRSPEEPRTKAGRTQIERSKVLDDGSLEKFPKSDPKLHSKPWIFWLVGGTCASAVFYVSFRRYRAAARRAKHNT